MTYVLGIVISLLLIALILVFRPPKRKSYDAYELKAPVDDESRFAGEQPIRDKDLNDNITEEAEEELDLFFEEPAEHALAQEENIEELVLDLEEDGAAADQVENDTNEYDEHIPFIEEDGDTFERKGEMAPALADIPDDYAQVDEDETPDELAERLEYFLGSDDEEVEEPEQEAVDAISVPLDEAAVIEEGIETVDDAAEGSQIAKEEQEETEAGPETYQADLKEQEEYLRRELKKAIDDHETGKLSALEVALENICAKQVDIQASFQDQQKLFEELEGIMPQVQEKLPGFQLEAVRQNLKKREYEVARNLLVEAANQLTDSPQLASMIFYHLGRILEDHGQLAEALEIYKKAFESDENSLESLLAAGRLSRITGDTENGLVLLEKRVHAGQESGEESVEFARAEHELARMLEIADEKDRVEPLLLHARETIESLYGSDHPDLGPVLHDLALMYDGAGRYEEAEPLYKKAVEVTEKGLGSDHPRLGTTLNKLAGLYEEIEMEEKSEPLYVRALEIKQKVLGENHPDVGTIMGHLANQLKMKGKYDQAEPMYRKSLEIAEAALGRDHPNLAVVLNDMAELYSEMGNEEQAEYFQERAFSLFGLPGMGDGFVEMDKDNNIDDSDDADKKVTEN